MSGATLRRGSALVLMLAAAAVQAQTQTLTPVEEPSAFDERPKWEAGVAAVALRTLNYPASDEYQTFALPAPYFIYHGRVLRADEDGGSRLRRKLTPTAELNISGGGGLSSDSSDSEARRGMPDLDYVLQLGPNLRLSYDGPVPMSKIIVSLPLRAVATVGDGLDWRGMVFAPELAYVDRRLLGGRLALRTSLNSDFASTALHRYFYDVAPAYATPTRPVYRSRDGYLGSGLDVTARYRFTPRLRGFVSLGYAHYAGAANDDSPLFRSDHGYTAVTGFSWSFLQSKARAVDD